MSYNLLKGKRGIIFGALDPNSIAWITAERVHEEGGKFVLSNAPIAMRMGQINELAEKTGSQVIAADATSEEDLETTYWLAFSLWKSKFWQQHLVGSVIPFLRKNDFQGNFNPKVKEMLDDFEAHQKDVKALRLLELKEEQFHQNINLINDLRRVILYRYCKKN